MATHGLEALNDDGEEDVDEDARHGYGEREEHQRADQHICSLNLREVKFPCKTCKNRSSVRYENITSTLLAPC